MKILLTVLLLINTNLYTMDFIKKNLCKNNNTKSSTRKIHTHKNKNKKNQTNCCAGIATMMCNIAKGETHLIFQKPPQT